MTEVIWKAPLKVLRRQTIEVPEDHTFIDLQMQDGVPTLWFRCDPNSPKFEKTIHMVGTGWQLNDLGNNGTDHIGTVQDGPMVWHFFA